MTEADRAPVLGRPSFHCPHCGAVTSQRWFDKIWVRSSKKDSLPRMPAADAFEDRELFADLEPEKAEEQRSMMIEWRDKMRLGEPFFESRSGAEYPERTVYTLAISECYVCRRLAARSAVRGAVAPVCHGLLVRRNLVGRGCRRPWKNHGYIATRPLQPRCLTGRRHKPVPTQSFCPPSSDSGFRSVGKKQTLAHLEAVRNAA